MKFRKCTMTMLLHDGTWGRIAEFADAELLILARDGKAVVTGTKDDTGFFAACQLITGAYLRVTKDGLHLRCERATPKAGTYMKDVEFCFQEPT